MSKSTLALPHLSSVPSVSMSLLSSSTSQLGNTVSSILSSYTSVGCLPSVLSPVSSHCSSTAGSTLQQSSLSFASPATSKPSVLGPDMMPTIPLVPVQVPSGRGGVVTVSNNKTRGMRHRGFPFLTGHSKPGFSMKRGSLKMKRLGNSMRVRGGRRLVHSMSLDERGRSTDISPFSQIEEESPTSYSQDDMYLAEPTFQEKWPGEVCALCNLGEGSQLGQGEFQQYDATPGYKLPDKLASPDHTTKDIQTAKRFKSHHLFKDKGKSPRKTIGDPLPEPIDEISLVGHAETPNLESLFNSSGQSFVHYNCALWSSGVELTSDDSITSVDKAIVAGACQRCSECYNLGATLPCRVQGCQNMYHFPCAVGAGIPMDLKMLALVCPDHADKVASILVDMACMVCDSWAPESSLLFCCTCGNHYHATCLKSNFVSTPTVRLGWQCNDCKQCQMCHQAADDIVCLVCDKAYHVACARPFGLSLSKLDWKCKNCRVCGDCGSRTPGSGLSSRWHTNFTVCDSCYQLRNKGLACSVCRKAYRAVMQRSMAQCSSCKRHIHNTCDPEADIDKIQRMYHADKNFEYICIVCKGNSHPKISPRGDSNDAIADLPDLSEDSTDTDFTSESKSDEPTTKYQPSGIGVNGISSSTSSSSISTTSFANTFSNLTNAVHTSHSSRGKPPNLSAKRGVVLFPRLRGGATGKNNTGKKPVTGRKRGSMVPMKRGRGNPHGRGYRGYFNYEHVTLQVSKLLIFYCF